MQIGAKAQTRFVYEVGSRASADVGLGVDCGQAISGAALTNFRLASSTTQHCDKFLW